MIIWDERYSFIQDLYDIAQDQCQDYLYTLKTYNNKICLSNYRYIRRDKNTMSLSKLSIGSMFLNGFLTLKGKTYKFDKNIY